MKRFFFILILLIAALAVVIVIPSFKLTLGNKSFVFPEINYGKIFGRSEVINFDFQKSDDFAETTVVKMLVDSGKEEDAKQIAEIARQRIEIMGSHSEASHFKEGEDYFVKLTVTGTGSLIDKQIFSLTNSEKVQIMKEKEQETDENGEPIVSEDFPFTPVVLDYDFAREAKLKFNSNIGRYVVEVSFDNSTLSGVNDAVTATSGGAFLGQEPIAAVVTGSAPTEAKVEFAASSEVGRKEALVLLSILGTKTYSSSVTEISREVFLPMRSGKDLLFYAVAFAIGFVLLVSFFYFTKKKIWKFVSLSLFISSVFTLALMKMPVFDATVNSSILTGLFINFICNAVILYYLANKLSLALEGLSSTSLNKQFNEVFGKVRAEQRLFLLFILYVLIIINMLYGRIGGDLAIGFGYGAVSLLIMFVFFLKNIFWNTYISPLKIKINVLKKVTKK